MSRRRVSQTDDAYTKAILGLGGLGTPGRCREIHAVVLWWGHIRRLPWKAGDITGMAPSVVFNLQFGEGPWRNMVRCPITFGTPVFQ